VPTNKPPADVLLDRAADLRAAGKSWEATAAALGYSAQTVRKWPVKYPTRWRKVHGAAELRLTIDAANEAVQYLRGQLRSAEPKVVQGAAKVLLHYRLKLEPHRRRAAAQKFDRLFAKFTRARFTKPVTVETVSHEQAVALAEHVHRADD
jgi:hypothetical protein